MSSQNEITELRSDIKEQTKEIANLTTSITQLVESYKHHKEVTDSHTQDIKILHEANNITDEKFNDFLLEYKPILDKAKKDQEEYSQTLPKAKEFFTSRSAIRQKVTISIICAACIAVGAKAPDVLSMFIREPQQQESKRD